MKSKLGNVASLQMYGERKYQNPSDATLREQRHKLHTKEQRSFCHPEHAELSEQRHQTHAKKQDLRIMKKVRKNGKSFFS